MAAGASPPPGAAGVPPGESVFRPFTLPGYHGHLLERLRPLDLDRAVERVTDPGAALKTLHWGRNYLFTVELATVGGPLVVVVKQFRNDDWRSWLRRRLFESKAVTSWKVALRLLEAGVPTPEPVLQVDSVRPGGPSFFATAELTGFVESRYLFRALRQKRAAELFPEIDVTAALGAMGRLARRMHDAGVWHRDFSIGNLLLTPPEGTGEPPRIHLIDLNRARLDRRLGELRRIRDICRLPIVERQHREVYLGAYWGEDPGPRRELLFRAAVRGFLLKNVLKATVRRPFRWLGGQFHKRRPHPHIPPAPAGAGRRDRVVWDTLSDQPHQHAGWGEKLREYATDSRVHLRAAVRSVAPTVRTLVRYTELRRGLYAEPYRFHGLGVGLRPRPDDPEAPLEAVEELGVGQVLLRLHPWEDGHGDEEELAAELSRRGVELTFTLPQDRELVRDPRRWRAAVERLAEAFLPYGNRFQIGQAVNRSKWGIWNSDEYLDLADAAAEILRQRGEVEVLGPSVIDFEFYATIALLNTRRGGCHFDGVASLLYVDRRGAPEHRQLGFDTVGKVILLKAIAETARNSGDSSWITEFNWPLREGPHSPAGRKVAVDEERQADFLVRFYLLALCTGLVDGAFWWQAIAKGYGLIDPEGLRRRPAFRALATMVRRLEGARFQRPLTAEGPARLYRFTDAEDRDLVVAWSAVGRQQVRLPGAVRAAWTRDGRELDPPRGRVEVGSSPMYFHLH